MNVDPATPRTVAVLGASGFVGTAVRESLISRGVRPLALRAPRLGSNASPDELAATREQLGEALRGCDAVINAAGVSEATSGNVDELEAANAVLPGVVALAARDHGIRFVHVSSAAVQGSKPCLDDSLDLRPFSPYSRSKARGEQAVLAVDGDNVVHRPAGVHGPERAVTRTLTRLACSRFSTVAAPGTAPTPQGLIDNVADAISFLATCPESPPRITTQPWEHLSTSGLLGALGGAQPRLVPRAIARAAMRTIDGGATLRPGLRGQVRRLEMLWFGQGQAPSWLGSVGWVPVQPPSAWEALGDAVRRDMKEES